MAGMCGVLWICGGLMLGNPPPHDSRFGSPLKLSKVHWVRPELVVEVTYLTWTEDSLLRQASASASPDSAAGAMPWRSCDAPADREPPQRRDLHAGELPADRAETREVVRHVTSDGEQLRRGNDPHARPVAGEARSVPIGTPETASKEPRPRLTPRGGASGLPRTGAGIRLPAHRRSRSPSARGQCGR
jgi:hypothetical protein